MPLDDPDEVISTKVRKMRREREVRLARKKVQEAVKGWEGLFDGGKGGKYFWVGRVDRGGEGWGERRELCEKAREGRPTREGKEEDGGRLRRAEDV